MSSNSEGYRLSEIIKAIALEIPFILLMAALVVFLLFCGVLCLAMWGVDSAWMWMLKHVRPAVYRKAVRERELERERFFNSSVWDPIHMPSASYRE